MKSQLLEWAELWDAMDSKPDQWHETTESMYYEMLCVLPPIKQIGDCFMVGEPLRHNEKGEAIYACFVRFGDRFKAKNLTIPGFINECA